MTEKQYGATDDKEKTTEKDPLIESKSSELSRSASRLPIVIGLDNAEFRAIVFGMLLFTWSVPSLIYLGLTDNVTDNIQTSDNNDYITWMVCYCCILGGMGFYEFTFFYLWCKQFGIDERNSLLVTIPRKICGILVGVGGIFLIAAVSDNLSNRQDKVGFFGIYMFPMLTTIGLSMDILMPQFGNNVRVRCSVLSGIIFISSLLIVIDVFDENWSFTTSVESVYEIGWLITMISGFGIHICCVSGLCNFLKKYQSTFIGLDYFAFCCLFSGISLTMCYDEGYINETRTAFLIFTQCAILCIEIFLL